MAFTDLEDVNYLGRLINIGASASNSGVVTPFLSAIGGLNGARVVDDLLFATASPYSLSAASQNTQSEATAATLGTPTTVTPGQDTNTCQIMKYDAGVSDVRQASTGRMSGTVSNIAQPETMDLMAFQKLTSFQQMAIDIEKSFLSGSFTTPSLSSTNQKTRGLANAISTNEIATGGAAISKTLVDQAIRTMIQSSGLVGNDITVICNVFNAQQLDSIYGYAPESVTVGGTSVRVINTALARLLILVAPECADDDVYFVNLNNIRPAILPHQVGGMGPSLLVSWSEVGRVAAMTQGFYQTIIGLDYGAEEKMASLTGLATS